MKRCPFCAEEIQDAAIVCRFCQRSVSESTHGRPASDSTSRPTLAKLFAAIGAIVLVLTVVGFMAVGPSAPTRQVPIATIAPSGVTLENYMRLSDGMSYDQVRTILQANGVEMSRTSIGGHESVMVMWQGPGIGNMNAMFQNGRLISKAQFGLR